MAFLNQQFVLGTDLDDLIDQTWPGRANPNAAEIVSGRKGNDNILGLGGDDSIDGGPGDDTINGGLGNDTTAGGTGSDRYVFGFDDGLDNVVDTAGSIGEVDSVLLSGTFIDFRIDYDGDDMIIGGLMEDFGQLDSNNNVRVVDQFARSGNGIEYLEIDTGESNSFYNDYSVVPDTISKIYTPSAPTGTDQGPYYEVIRGTHKNDTIHGGGGYRDEYHSGDGNDLLIGADVTNDRMFGDDGNDTMRGLGGNDVFRGQAGNDVIDGGEGIDRLDFTITGNGATSAVHVDLNKQGSPQLINAQQGWDTLISIEEVRGSNFNDTLIGDDNDNTLFGGRGAPFPDGNDLIFGKGGNDALLGIDGNDTLLGGAGADNAEGGEGNDSIDGGSEDDYLAGGAGNDTVKGGSGNDFIEPGEGNDRIDAGGGDDVVESGSGNGNDTIAGGDGRDTIYGGEDNDSASGGAEADELSGRGGTDILNGDSGDDYIAGEDGNDTMRGGAGNDLILGSIGDDQLFGDANDDWLRGDAGNDTMRGGAGSDTYVQEANAGFSGFDLMVQIDGNATTVDSAYVGAGLYDLDWYREGKDLIITGAVNENYDVNDTGYLRFQDHYGSGSAGLDYFEGDTIDNAFYTDQSVNLGGIARVYTATGNSGQNQGGYTEVLWGGAGNDKMQGNGGYRDYLYGDAGNDTLTGSDGTIDHLRGGSGNDRLLGMGGNDRLRGGEGNDLVNGGDGRDRVEYLDANGGVTVDLNIQGIPQSVGADQGKDTLISIEEVRGSRFADLMIGNATGNFMIGEGGDDTMIGGEGLDSFLGGEGSDVYKMTAVGTGVGGFFDFSAGESGDVLDVSAIIDFGESGLPLSEYLLAEDAGNALQIFVDIDGGGDNFQPLVALYGASGQSVESLLAQGNLIVDGTVAV